MGSEHVHANRRRGGTARQSATLSRLAHEKLTDPAVGRLLDDLRPYEESLPYDADDAALIHVARREFERAVKVPSAFVAELSGHLAASYQIWTEARPADDFAKVRPLLEKTLDLSRQLAGYFAPYDHIADPLIDMADYGMRVATLRPLFGQLRGQLVPIVEAIAAQPPAADACLRQHFPERAQWDFAVDVIKRFGYDFDRGRLDKTHHPFMTKFSLGDVRITTRVAEDFLGENLFSVMHESGHAMYEQGIRMAYEGTPLAERHLGRRAREPVAAVGERRRPQPVVLAALLPRTSDAFSRATRRRRRSTRSIARSTRCSGR